MVGPVVNPRHACARVTVVVACVCLCVCVCLSVCVCVCLSVPALAASVSVETSKQWYSRVSFLGLMCGVSKKPSIEKLWREKVNMQMSWSSPSAAFAQFRDQQNAAAT